MVRVATVKNSARKKNNKSIFHISFLTALDASQSYRRQNCTSTKDLAVYMGVQEFTRTALTMTWAADLLLL
jgi:hypothetical protein